MQVNLVVEVEYCHYNKLSHDYDIITVCIVIKISTLQCAVVCHYDIVIISQAYSQGPSLTVVQV